MAEIEAEARAAEAAEALKMVDPSATEAPWAEIAAEACAAEAAEAARAEEAWDLEAP